MVKFIAVLVLAVFAGCTMGPPQVDDKKIMLTEEELAYVVSHPVVTWAAEDDRPPYVLLSGGVYKGLSVTYLNLISKKTGLKFTPIRTVTFADSISAVENGKVDVIPSLRPTPDRSESMSFTPPYIYSGGVFMFRSDSLPRSPLTTGIRRSEAVEDYLHTRFPEMKIVKTDDDEQNVGLLEKGLLDGSVMDNISANYWAKHSTLTCGHIGSSCIRMAVINFDYPYSIAYSKDNHVLGSILTKAINSISADDKKKLDDYAQKQEL